MAEFRDSSFIGSVVGGIAGADFGHFQTGLLERVSQRAEIRNAAGATLHCRAA